MELVEEKTTTGTATLIRRTNDVTTSIQKLFPTAKGMREISRTDLLKAVTFVQSTVNDWRGLVENGAETKGFQL